MTNVEGIEHIHMLCTRIEVALYVLAVSIVLLAVWPDAPASVEPPNAER
jgi:hypothetical protein